MESIQNEEKNQPLVSVMMPVYNGERTIELAIKSLLIQTYNNWLCVIVNDCSTDGTADILKKYEQDSRFKIIHLPENKGRGNARQVAVDNAEGKYLAFLDADDFYHPEKIYRQVSILQRFDDIIMVSSAMASFDKNKKICSIRGKGSNQIIHADNKNNFSGFIPSTMLIRELAIKIKYNLTLDVGEDIDFINRYLKGCAYYMLEDAFYYYEEVGAVTFKKLIKYQIKSLKARYHMNKKKPLKLIQSLSTRLLKLSTYAIISIFIDVDKILMRRGTKPNTIERKNYNKTINFLLS